MGVWKYPFSIGFWGLDAVLHMFSGLFWLLAGWVALPGWLGWLTGWRGLVNGLLSWLSGWNPIGCANVYVFWRIFASRTVLHMFCSVFWPLTGLLVGWLLGWLRWLREICEACLEDFEGSIAWIRMLPTCFAGFYSINLDAASLHRLLYDCILHLLSRAFLQVCFWNTQTLYFPNVFQLNIGLLRIANLVVFSKVCRRLVWFV